MFESGLVGVRPNYTKADIPNAWVNASRLAFFTSAFEGTAVMTSLRLKKIETRLPGTSLRAAMQSL